MYGERGYAVVVPSALGARIYWLSCRLEALKGDLLHRMKACCPVMERQAGDRYRQARRLREQLGLAMKD